MNTLSTAFLSLILLLAAPIATYTQNSFELTSLGENVIRSVQMKRPDWKYEAVPPITGSADVILQQWTLEYQSIRIAIVSHKSADDAAMALRDLAGNGQAEERLDLGDEDVTWGLGIVSFRRRNLTVSVSAINTKPTLDVSEVADNVGDERKLAKEFARLVADAIKDK